MEQNFDLTYFTDVKSKRIEWLWYPYIPLGKITILQGDPGEGKTTFILDLISRMSNGENLPCSDKKVSGIAIYQNTEDDISDTIKPRLIKSKAECKNVCFIDSKEMPIVLDDSYIEQAIVSSQAKLLVLDPIQSFLGVNCDMNRAAKIRPKMTKLKEVAARTGCAIVLVGHLNKNTRGKSNYRGLGSIDISAAARSILYLGKLPAEPSVRILTQIKNNLAPLGESLGFTLSQNGVEWQGVIDITADELLSGAKQMNAQTVEAVELLKTALEDGRCKSTEIIKLAEDMGYSRRTLLAAKAQLPIRSVKKGSTWYWELI